MKSATENIFSIDILGVRIDQIDEAGSMNIIRHAVENRKRLRVITANPELIYHAEKDEPLRDMINSADVIVPDGVGVVWAARILGKELKQRVTGIDLAIRILEEGSKNGWRIFLLGSKPGVAQKAATEQSKVFPGVIFASHHGYFTREEEPALLDKIRDFAPDVLLTGLGAPKQEYWNQENNDLAPVKMGVGGSLDVLAGEVKRAPQFFQRWGIEWLYRLISEPSRIRRQVVLPLYLMRVIQQKHRHTGHKET
ncbi:WecB/TagA/CpsF family glycosyltransferase [Dehalobacter sp. DCM]|uniref:WecB/TagA/CpsF family glycosyltransferase n=1 Tax=Dehalobacter sp. DCM TaxID=2907827 RepID=UPI003081AC76|nr:WecB/TagA/CpsF family glycosyltransferase [Dehalobacter sp. DCM]